MLKQELKDIWNNSSQTARISIEKNQLIEELNTSVNSMQKTIRIRDIGEISASVIGILIFVYLLYEIPFPITKLACTFSVIWFVFVISKFRKSNKQNTATSLSLSMSDQLSHQRTTMEEQVKLLESAVYWYSIPPFIINFIFIVGLGDPVDYKWINSIAESLLPLNFLLKTGTLTGLALFYLFTIWMNKRAVKKGIKPILENIKTMQEQLRNE
jgi:hypothetical protein